MGQRSVILAIALVIFTFILGIVFVIGKVKTGKTPVDEVAETVEQERSRSLVSVKDIVSEPMVYAGYNLEIDSKITGWVTNNAFYFSTTIGGGFGGGAKRSLLVIAKEPFTLPQDPTDNKLGLGEIIEVHASGKIEILNENQLEEILKVDFDDPNNKLYDEFLQNWTLGPVLMLNEIKPNKIIK